MIDFQKIVWEYYRKNGRDTLPWRQVAVDGSIDPYEILVSEIMLQQTQVMRVVPKYTSFLETFPTVKDLANTELGTVLGLWSGLGYNRRAKYLWQAAQKIETDYRGAFPTTADELKKLPGVGTNTAGAIITYAYNRPEIFIETNIRTVFIHHFFHDSGKVSDSDIKMRVARTLPGEGRYRDWYWALMDYGAHLKQTVGNLNRNSATYARQSQFSGSLRQIRGQVIKSLADEAKEESRLSAEISDDRLGSVIETLITEGLIRRKSDKLSL